MFSENLDVTTVSVLMNVPRKLTTEEIEEGEEPESFAIEDLIFMKEIGDYAEKTNRQYLIESIKTKK